MTNTKKEPSSAPAALNGEHGKEQGATTTRKGAQQEPKSDPTGVHPNLRDIESLSEEQLRKLTKANTRKNHGGRSSRLRSQVERVFRRLDNLAADVKLQPRYSLDALPVVSPDDPSAVLQNDCSNILESSENVMRDVDQDHARTNADSPESRVDQPTVTSPEEKVSHGSEQRLDPMPLENEEFEIEPATNNSAFTDLSNSLGVLSGSARSVRISTSVTVLDYMPTQPVSIARLRRYEHPTRTGKCLQTRTLLAEAPQFPKAMQRLDQIREGEHPEERGIERRTSVGESLNRRKHRPSPPPPRRVRSTGSTPTAYIVPSATGPYGSRANFN